MSFGKYIRGVREAKDVGLRELAKAIDVDPTYLSRIEQDKVKASEEAILAIAGVLGEDKHVLLALAGKVSSELQDIIRRHPKAFAALIEQLKDAPEHAILRVVREVRDGEW